MSIYDYQNCTYFFSTEANEAFKFRIACVGSVLGFCGLIEPPDNNQQCVKRVERGGVRAKEGRKEGRKENRLGRRKKTNTEKLCERLTK